MRRRKNMSGEAGLHQAGRSVGTLSICSSIARAGKALADLVFETQAELAEGNGPRGRSGVMPFTAAR